MYKATAGKIAVYAWDGATGAPKTGDAANITAKISKDGAASAATNDVNPTELSAANNPGVYLFDITSTEADADLVILSPVSSTADVVMRPVFIYTQMTSTTIAAAVWEVVIENTLKAKHLLSCLLSYVANKRTGGGTTALVYRNNADSVDRITQTVNTKGEVSVSAIDVSDIP